MSTGIIVSSINDDKINVMCRLYLFYHHFKIIIMVLSLIEIQKLFSLIIISVITS